MKYIRKDMVLMLWSSSFLNLAPAVPCKISFLCFVSAIMECVQWSIFTKWSIFSAMKLFSLSHWWILVQFVWKTGNSVLLFKQS